MRKPILNSRRVQIGVVVFLLVCSFLPSRWAATLSRQPRYLLGAAMAPVDHFLKPWADAVRRPPDLPIDLGNREEYERAKQQIVELQYRLAQANRQIALLSQIRHKLRLVGVGLIPATVTAWSGDPLHPTLTVNRGSRHGLRSGLVVVRGFNLIGRVADVGPVTSTVGLITAPLSHLVALIKPPTEDSQPREMMLQLQAIKGRDEFWASTNADDPVRVGDLAQLYDDAWPTAARGFVIGKVTRIDNHPDDPILRRRMVVTPIRSLAHLDHITVIVPTGQVHIQEPRGED